METAAVPPMARPDRNRFEKIVRVPFSACDPAGIMFFAQYYVMFQNLVDDWITDELGISYADLLGARGVGLPTVRFETDFRVSSRMGDTITLGLEIERVGERSLTLHIEVCGPEGVRVTARQVIVCASFETNRSMPFPGDLRAALVTFHSPG